MLDYLGTNLKTALSDTRPQGYNQVLRPHIVLLLHQFNGSCDDALECPAPTRMDSCHSARPLVCEQDWKAIGGLNRKQRLR